MAPKKKQQQQKKQQQSQKPQSSGGPKLQISASLSRAQKAKKLKSVYEKLSCEGFSDDQIERALNALKVFFFLICQTRCLGLISFDQFVWN